MRDITHKPITLRTARAVGVVFCDASTVALVHNGQLPKGNLFDVARAAGLLGAKQTAHLLPHCHPVSIDGMELRFEWLEPALHNEIIGEHSDREHFVIVPDEKTAIRQQIRQWVSEDIPFIFTTGGTGPGPRDTTVGAVRELLECEAPGIAEAMRSYGRLVLGQARSFGAGEVPLEQAFGRVFVGSVRADRDYPLFLVLQWTDLRRFLPIWTRVLGSGGVLWDPAGYASQYAGPATCGQRGPGTGRSRSLLSHLISRYYRTFK